jgi:hypothetical protein
MTEDERRVLDTVLEGNEEEGEENTGMAQMNAITTLREGLEPNLGEASPLGLPQPSTNQVLPQEGGMPVPDLPLNLYPSRSPADEAIRGASVPGMSNVVIPVDTSPIAMMSDGIMPEMGMGRQIRRNTYRGGMGMSPMMPSVSRYTPSMNGDMNGLSASGPNTNGISSGATVTVTKLE